MSKLSDPKLVALSGKIYERLLALYPREHRREYGSLMAQLFRDQCRDAWTEARGWALAFLWLRISIDLAKTSTLEHLRNLKQRKSMFNRALPAFRNNPVLRTTFLALFSAVFVLVLGSSVLVAILAPEQYSSTARIQVERTASEITPGSYQGSVAGSDDPHFIPNQIVLMRSEPILGRVAKKLNLAESWGSSSAGGVALSEAETIRLLKQRVELRPVRNTRLIDVSVHCKSAREAATIANVLALTMAEQPRRTSGAEAPWVRPVSIVDFAEPNLRPVWPRRHLTLFLGVFGGILAASVVAGIGACLVHLTRTWSRTAARGSRT